MVTVSFFVVSAVMLAMLCYVGDIVVSGSVVLVLVLQNGPANMTGLVTDWTWS